MKVQDSKWLYETIMQTWPKSVFYGASISKYLGFNALHPSTKYYGS